MYCSRLKGTGDVPAVIDSKWYDVCFIVDVVLFYFAKVSYVVSYYLLLDKLRRLLGICSPLIDWTANFLIGILIGMRALVSGIRNGVPQGAC